ncbi:MAG: S-adenosylmethionine:tRNA ribosyltransferase-isomerase [Bacteroidia bacterium]|nr:S-adenosylmethionine:tRNA ribosyltransferase-isomerase [Bacteroidia bacterium]
MSELIKTKVQQINIKDYSYHLPESNIALYPLEKRDESKLLIYQNESITESIFSSLHQHLPQQSLLVFNNTKVIHARLLFKRATGAVIEVFCIEPVDHLDYQLAFTSKHNCIWKCMVGNAKRWKEDILEKWVETPQGQVKLTAEKTKKEGELFVVKFTWDNPYFFFGEILHYAGILPIPPYLNRDTEQSDEERYQTIYASVQGSVAAPTAGLHFTQEVFESLSHHLIDKTEVTLHVGAGTFKPVKSESLQAHEMHEETIYIELASLKKIKKQLHHKLPIVAVGTTSMRTLESVYWYGASLITGNLSDTLYVSQWQPYEQQLLLPTAAESIEAVINKLESAKQTTIQGSTQIIIAPGYQFKIVDALITNFHQPENTLILLIAAFVNEDWRKIYDYALQHQFRFLSYGDSSLLWRKN